MKPQASVWLHLLAGHLQLHMVFERARVKSCVPLSSKNTEFVRICNTQGVIVLKQTLIWSPEVESKKEQILLFCTSVVDFSGICTMSSIQKQSAKHSHVLHSSPLITGYFPCATICWELDVLVEKHTLHFCYFLNMYRGLQEFSGWWFVIIHVYIVIAFVLT